MCKKYLDEISSVDYRFICFDTGFAQDLTVNGKVLDGAFDNQPLAFANVKVKDLDISVETDIDGSYQLNLLKGRYTLVS